MKTFISIMSYLREELRHEGLFIGKKHSRTDKQFIRRELKQLM